MFVNSQWRSPLSALEIKPVSGSITSPIISGKTYLVVNQNSGSERKWRANGLAL